MRHFYILILSIALIIIWLLPACRIQEESSGPSAPAPASKPGPAGEWDNVVSAAKKEGVVFVYTTWKPETRILLTQALKDKFGINLEFVPFGRGEEMLARVQAERTARLNLVDVLGTGTGVLMPFKKVGLLGASLEPMLILPEAKDPAAWRGGQLPFTDKEKRMVAMVAVVQRRILYNTDLVKENDITGYRDILDPRYKGKITLNDPSVSGAGIGWFADLARDIWNVDEASEYLRQLVKQQDAAVVRDTRLHVETVARGKYAIGIAPTSEISRDFIKLGAPLDFVILKEGVFVGPGSGALGLAPEPPHPNATSVFLNWLLTREGQTLFSVKSFGSPSFRLDTPVEGIPRVSLLGADEKYWLETEDLVNFRGEMTEVARKVMERAKGQ